MNTLEAVNRAVFLLINGTTASPAWLVGMAMLIASYMIYLAGGAVTRWVIMLYRKLLSRPIALGWLRN